MMGRRALAVFALCWVGVRPAAGQCLVVADDTPLPRVARPEVDIRQVLQLTTAGEAAVRPFKFLYVEITREAGSEVVDGRRVAWPQETFVRMIDPAAANTRTPFTFSRPGWHSARLIGTAAYSWPAPADPPAQGSPVPSCEPFRFEVSPAVLRADFSGTRGQWWATVRLPAKLGAGASVFVGRLGLAASTELSVPEAIGPRHDPSNANRVTAAVDLRWRGTRGYLGGGIRYYPDPEPNRDRVRAVFVAGEELPTFKGRPLWLLVDLSLQEPQKNFFKGLNLNVGVRFDLWGSRP